ncbi:MAG: gloA5 [Rhizobium sp.]|nr:gloA5 [Rhizobium sp.]
MPELRLHHVSIIVRDLDISLPFYREVFGLEPIVRPPFPFPGAWLGCGTQQIHLIVHADGSFRTSNKIDRSDLHFAFRTDDFEAIVAKLQSMGFNADAAEGDPKKIYVNRQPTAGFPQIFLLDPDRNIIEINGAP